MDNSFWISKCVAQLMKLRPDMDGDDALRIARSAWVRTTGQTPEQAAQFFAVKRSVPADSPPVNPCPVQTPVSGA